MSAHAHRPSGYCARLSRRATPLPRAVRYDSPSGAPRAFFPGAMLAARFAGDRSNVFYRVWLSEIMLQQTRVEAVTPYYRLFLERFPSIESLAAAPENDVLKAWSGLGYYSRARTLYLGGESNWRSQTLPATYEEVLLALRGRRPVYRRRHRQHRARFAARCCRRECDPCPQPFDQRAS